MSAPLFYELALPDDPALDVFACGDDEVDRYFRSRGWFDAPKGQASPPTYVFRVEEGGFVVGYAALAFRNYAHPDDQSEARARYLTIYAVGVNTPLHGKPNPRAPRQTFAASIFSVIASFAAEKAGCAGLSLWVRAGNGRAIRFYEKEGFVADPHGPVQRDKGAPHLTMRKLLASR